MRRYTLILFILVLVSLSETGRKKKPGKGKKPKPGKGGKPQKRGQCLNRGGKLTAENTAQYTNTTKGLTCTCWWDMNKHDCACCNEGVNAMQCGFPMHEFCWMKGGEGSSRGCPGICNNEWTLSEKGYPCYSDPSNKNCGWCTPAGNQCAQDKWTGPKPIGKRSRCIAPKNTKYCKNQQADCYHIPDCDPNATCERQKKAGKFREFYQCKCGDGYTGNGIQCADANGTISYSPNVMVDVSLTFESDLYTYPHVDGELSPGISMAALLTAMEETNTACQGQNCEATLNIEES